MDAMALLCNLQADGPATLRRLRKVGCQELADLERVGIFELADALGGDAAFAQRFVREGRALNQRFGPGSLEPEEAQVSAPSMARAPERIPTKPRSLREPVTAESSTQVTEPEMRRLVANRPVPRRIPARALPAQPPGTPLRAGLIEGLDADWTRDLIGQGILTLECLRDAPGLPLAKSLGRKYTELVDLQCFARRRLDQATRASATLEREGAPPEQLVVEPQAAPRTERDYMIFPPARSTAADVRSPSTGRPDESVSKPVAEPIESASGLPVDSQLSQVPEDVAGIGGPFA